MDIFAKKLINDHRNPLVKVDLPSSKLFLKSSTQEETEFIEKHQSALENILKHERAERRCARSQAMWSREDELAKVTKTLKTLNNFGYRDKSGTYLYSEETLFLMETNRLEVTYNGLPLSIQEGYDLLLKSCKCDVLKYRVYKKLVLLGYRLVRCSELLRRLSKTTEKYDVTAKDSNKSEQYVRKRVSVGENDKTTCKKQKLNSETEEEKSVTNLTSGSASNPKDAQFELVRDIFEKLRGAAPKEYSSDITDDLNPDYYVFLPNNKSRCDYDFSLYICRETVLRKQYNNFSVPSIFAICSEGNISFYRFSTVNLPFL